jgi:hypothetical protein
LFGPGELEYHVYSQQQELLQLEDAYPHLLCLRPLNPASADTLSSQHPHYQSFLRLKAPLVWYMLTGWVGKDIMKAAVLAMLAAAAGVSEGLTSVAHPPPLSREDSDGLGSPSGSSSVISSYTAALSSVFTDGVSTDSLLTIVSGETVTETGEIAQAFLADVSGSVCVSVAGVTMIPCSCDSGCTELAIHASVRTFPSIASTIVLISG